MSGHAESQDVLRLRGVSFAYDGRPAVLRGVDLELRPGEVLALLGTNGSGKSTLCRLACGLLTPGTGEVTVDGWPAADRPWRLVQFVPQDPADALAWPTVFDDVAFAPRNAGQAEPGVAEVVRESLHAVGLAGFEQRDVETLSAGERQRLVLAGALAAQPRYLVLDEPAAHLDPIAASRLLRLVAALAHQRGLGVLLVTHVAETLLACDRAAVLHDGRIVREGPAGALAADAGWLRDRGIEPPPVAVVNESLRRRGFALPFVSLRLKEFAACLTRQRSTP